MDFSASKPTPHAPSDSSDFSQAASDSLSDFGATQPQQVKAAAVENLQNFRTRAGEKAVAIKNEATVKLKQGAEKAKQLHSSAEDYVRENPTKAVLGAVGVGVLIGLIMRR